MGTPLKGGELVKQNARKGEILTWQNLLEHLTLMSWQLVAPFDLFYSD